MRTLAGVLVMSVIATMLAVAALAQLAIALLPYLGVALIVALVLRWRSPGRVHPDPRECVRPAPPRGYRIGAPAPAPEGWVMLPVWIAPTRPGPPVIDGEVITDGG